VRDRAGASVRTSDLRTVSKDRRTILFYVITLAVFGVIMYFLVGFGAALESPVVKHPGEVPLDMATGWDTFKDTVQGNAGHDLAMLLLQVFSIIAVARLFGTLFNRMGQPSVIGEIVAGIVLGPSVLGYWFPGLFEALFPEGSLNTLKFMSQIGLILFMFVVGMELDLKVLGRRAHDAVVISHASIIIPYALGMALAYVLYQRFAPPDVPFLSFALFMGIAMSITAFPVLARVVQERGLSRTRLGTIAITCAAADDITAWCILAAVIAIVKAGSALSALFTIGVSVLYVLAMIKLVRPFMRRLGDIHADRDTIGKPVMALVFLVLIASSYCTEIIGIHALFGAFLAGTIMPANLKFRKALMERTEDVSVVFLLPLFFVYTGLRTRIGLLNEPGLWGICALVIVVAVVGKFGGSAIAARFTGHSWKDSMAIGALMNTRGLMELVVLNIGYDLGILSPSVFVMLVLMALITTFMTGPALTLIERWWRREPEAVPAVPVAEGHRVLISFGQPSSGRKLLRLAHQLTLHEAGRSRITALHFTASDDLNPIESQDIERDAFKPVRRESEALGLEVETVHRASHDIPKDIVQYTNTGGFDLLLVGSGQALLKGTFLGELLGFTSRALDPGKLINTLTGRERLFPADDQLDDQVRQFIEGAQCSVGIFLDKGFDTANDILLPIFTPGDMFLFTYAERFMRSVEARVTVLDVTSLTTRDPVLNSEAQRLMRTAPGRLTILEHRHIDKEFLARFRFLLVSYASWERLAESRSVWLSHVPSTLIVKP
jgi:Kef-type K+ transport system membrane component KefB/nucleotide-binding universal stress UspA family protein